jgi:hypothetical protein
VVPIAVIALLSFDARRPTRILARYGARPLDRVPHETFALLLREAPVHRYGWKLGRGSWCVTKHPEVVAVSLDTKLSCA